MTSASPPPPARHGLVLAALLVLVLAGALWVGWRRMDDALASLSGAPFGDRLAESYLDHLAGDLAPTGHTAPVDFEVSSGEPVTSVAGRLEEAGVIRSAVAFRLLARVRGLDRGIQAGDYVLNGGMSAEEVLAALQVARAPATRVTIPEGRRSEEVAEVLGAAGVVAPEALLAVAADPSAARSSDFGVVAARPPEAGLEGYLFPDTYDLSDGSSAEDIVTLLARTFADRYAALGGAVPPGLSDHDVVTLASIVEREAQLAEERPKIARVFLNRLSEPPYFLGADPTVQYALGLQLNPRTWWKRPLLVDDLQAQSPYNTYVTPGLPPGPIANPGADALDAVRNPADGPWMYFVANEVACDGSHVFATTFEEHQANIARYRTGACLP